MQNFYILERKFWFAVWRRPLPTLDACTLTMVL
jgi:hypothetical protein